jgi:hypothetical protein
MRKGALLLVLLAACATRAPLSARASTSAEEALAAFSGALAAEGMSVPLPPRVCFEESREQGEPGGSGESGGSGGCAPRWDDDIGCVALAPACAARAQRESLIVYARAIVKERLPQEGPSRADALVEAWLAEDRSFASLAREIEHDFDERRAAPKQKRAPPPKPKKSGPRPALPAADAGTLLEEEPAPDAGPEGDDAQQDGADEGADEGEDFDVIEQEPIFEDGPVYDDEASLRVPRKSVGA